jgi:hypothetical protein
MILRAAIAFLFVAATLAVASGDEDANWRKWLTPLEPGPFPPPPPVTLTYGFGWEGMRAATAVFHFTAEPDHDRLVLVGKVSTEGLVRSLWKLDANQRSRVQASTLRTLDTNQSERYRSKSVTTQLEFLPDRVVEKRVRKPPEKNNGRARNFKLPDLLDMHGGLLFLRSRPLLAGDRMSILVYPSSAPYLTRVTVEGRERITVKAGTFDAIRARIELWKVDRDFSLKPHGKFKRATAWMSDDSRRLLLKVEGSVFVGSVWAELETIREPE